MVVTTTLPVAVIGAGPIGLAAAAHLLERGLQPLILEAGPTAVANRRLATPSYLEEQTLREQTIRDCEWFPYPGYRRCRRRGW